MRRKNEHKAALQENKFSFVEELFPDFGNKALLNGDFISRDNIDLDNSNYKNNIFEIYNDSYSLKDNLRDILHSMEKEKGKIKFDKETLLIIDRMRDVVNNHLLMELWADREDKKEDAESFFRRVWLDDVLKREVTRQDIRQKDRRLYQTLSKRFERNGIPDDLKIWWDESNQKSSEIDKLIDSLDIKEPKDVYRKFHGNQQEKDRLYQAALRRKRR